MFHPKAILFDMDGTMVDNMEYHTLAWCKMFNEDMNVPISWEKMKENSYGTNVELLQRILGTDAISVEEAKRIEGIKEKRYQETFVDHLQLIDGLSDFMAKAKAANVKLAIGTAAPRTNLDFVVDRLAIRNEFDAIVDGEDVTNSKPDPEVFLKCASQLAVDPKDCVVFEDSPKGVEAARRAGMKAVVVLSYNEKAEFEHLDNVLFYIHDYKADRLRELF